MANEEHVKIVRQGAEAIESWRSAMPRQRFDLIDADLQGANLEGANLEGARLNRARLGGTNLRNANLANADLSEQTGLLADDLSGADVTNARLPDALREFEGVKGVEAASMFARALFLTSLLACVYSWLTIATTTDSRLLTNSASSPLPIIGVEIPIVGFYWAAPLLLLCLYFYLHLYMQRLWERLARLPAVLPDGRALDEHAHPWLLNGLVRFHFARLRGELPPFSHLQRWVSILLAWWVVPLTLVLFWARFLPRKDGLGTSLHALLCTVSMVAAVIFLRRSRATLRGQKRGALVPLWEWRRKETYVRFAGVLGVGVVPFLFSWGAIEGVPVDRRAPWELTPRSLGDADPRLWVPWTLSIVEVRTHADLLDVEVSTRAALSNVDTTDGKTTRVRGADLEARDLRYLFAERAFLISANLRDANLVRARLFQADLRGADLTGADLRYAHLTLTNLSGAKARSTNFSGAGLWETDLREADLIWANFSGARLRWADLSGADLMGADLTGANLTEADLTEADLTEADLTEADLTEADLDEADLRGARGLSQAQVMAAENWKQAVYDEELRAELGISQEDADAARKKVGLPTEAEEAAEKKKADEDKVKGGK